MRGPWSCGIIGCVKVELDSKFQILAGIAHQALASGELPTRIKLLNWGENPSAKGPVLVNEQTLSCIEAQRAGEAFKRLLIDFDHQSEPKSGRYIPSPRKHVGYGDIVCLAEDGIYLDAIEYTPAGKEFAREYSDISPTVAFIKGSKNVVGAVSSVALCPNGAVHDLTFLSADEMPGDQSKLLEQISAMNEAMKALAAEVKALKDENAWLKQANEDLVKKLDSTVTTFSADTARALAAAESLERQTLLEKAIREGKVIPLSADALTAIGLPELREMVTLAKPGVVPMQPRTPARVQDGAEPARATEISRMCGVKPTETQK